MMFQYLKSFRDLVVCDREEFLWDEDPDVRRMLALVFSEEDCSGQQVERVDPNILVETPVIFHTSTVEG